MYKQNIYSKMLNKQINEIEARIQDVRKNRINLSREEELKKSLRFLREKQRELIQKQRTQLGYINI